MPDGGGEVPARIAELQIDRSELLSFRNIDGSFDALANVRFELGSQLGADRFDLLFAGPRSGSRDGRGRSGHGTSSRGQWP